MKSNSLCRRTIISEDVRLTSDILQVTDFLKLKRLVVAVDIQKACDSANHLFPIITFKKIVFGGQKIVT